MATLNPYLAFNDSCETAFTFYRSVFGGEFEGPGFLRFGDNDQSCPEGEKDKVMHVALPINDKVTLMGSDCPSSRGPIQFGNSVTINIGAESEEEARRIFDGLSAGGNVMMPLEKQFWGDLFGMLADQFGILWSVSFGGK